MKCFSFASFTVASRGLNTRCLNISFMMFLIKSDESWMGEYFKNNIYGDTVTSLLFNMIIKEGKHQRNVAV